MDELYDRGLAVRQSMFGVEQTQARLDGASEFTREFEALITRYCFGEIWTRGELPRDVRSMLTLAMLVALGKPHEIQAHVRGAIANGVSSVQIREVLLHAAIYCGVPAAVDGFRNASEVLSEMGEE